MIINRVVIIKRPVSHIPIYEIIISFERINLSLKMQLQAAVAL